MVSNLDPVGFSKEMFQFEDRISMAGSFLSFLGWEWKTIIKSVIYWRKFDKQLEKGQRVNPLDSGMDLMRTNKIRLSLG